MAWAKVRQGVAIFAFDAWADVARHQVGHQLLAVADSQGRGAGKRENSGVHSRAAFGVDTRRAAGDNDAPGTSKLSRRNIARLHFRIDPQLSYFAGDEVAILPARIQNNDL